VRAAGECAGELRAMQENRPRIRFHALREHAGLVFHKQLDTSSWTESWLTKKASGNTLRITATDQPFAMTVTIKLDAALEERLRQTAASSGRSTSDVVRAALQAYLDAPGASGTRSAYELGADLFGRHHGAVDLATRRKAALADAWGTRHARRGR
jgi:plasmid stability protein